MPEEEGSLGVPYRIINGKKVYAKKLYRKSKFGKFGTSYKWYYPDLGEKDEPDESEQR